MNSAKQQLKKVYLSADVYAVCLQHALSTEKEEVMGLLIGEVDEETGCSNISSCLILRRSDKQADRVEISAEQLMAATTHAEQLAHKMKQPMRVVGWYHSHPHITVWPSRVDVGTQAMYQTMDAYFVGLIFSVFPNETRNSDSASSPKSNEVQLTCFQSQGVHPNYDRREIPYVIRKSEIKQCNLEIMAQLPEILREEEEELAENSNGQAQDDELCDPLVKLHNRAHKFTGMVHITVKVARPICEILAARMNTNKTRIAYLQKQKQQLLAQVQQLTVALQQ